jgi:glucans biosynthesis protein C
MAAEARADRATGARFAYLDNLKILLVVGVIAVHVSITYGIDGAWYLESYDPMAAGVIDAVTVFVGIGFLFGLGLFFLIAGRLSGPSLDRKGPRHFVVDRLVRLGIPVVFYTLTIGLVMEYVKARHEGETEQAFLPFAGEQISSFAPGPTWFLEALLVFSLGYALWRVIRPGAPPRQAPLHGRQLVVAGIAIAVLSFLTHLVFPIGEEHFHVQFALFPQYGILFGLGCAAGRRGWLESLSGELQRRCGIAALLAVLALPAVMLAGGFFDGDEELFEGGWHWQAAAGAALEGTLAASAPIFLIGYFRRHFDRQRSLARWMAPNAYGAFIVHPAVIVGLALALDGLDAPAELKFIGVLIGGVAGSFGITSLVARFGPIARVIGSAARPSAPAPAPGVQPRVVAP